MSNIILVFTLSYYFAAKIAESYESSDHNSDDNEVIVRKVGEAVVSTISSVVSVLEYPKSKILFNFVSPLAVY